MNGITLSEDTEDQLLNTEYTPNTLTSGVDTDSLYGQEGDSLSEDVLVAEGVRYRRTIHHDADNNISDTEL